MDGHDSSQVLSAEDRASILSLLAAVRHPPKTLVEKMSIVELCRAWFVHGCAALVLLIVASVSVYKVLTRVADNTEIAMSVRGLPERVLKQEKRMHEIRPLVRKHEWQVKQGLTNADLKAKGITAPEFPEED
jgi:hypothetical protein